MVRTVRVRLELDRNDFKQGLRDSANDLRGFDAEVKTLGKDAQRTGVELKDTGTTAKKLGDDVKTSARDFKTLEQRVTETKTSMRNLAIEFERTGKADVSKQFRSASTELGRLNRMAKELEGTGAKGQGLLGGSILGSTIKNSDIGAMGAEAGSVFGGGFLQGAGRVLQAGGPVLIPAIAGLVAFAGAAIAGATLGATGLGAIAAGIALQFNSPAVHNAATDLGSFVKQQLTSATEGFGPAFVAGISALRREAEPLWAALRAGLQSLDPYVANLLVRLGEGLAKMGPGLQHALEAAGPVLGALAKNIPTLLNAIGIFFDQISKGGVGATMAIDAIVKIVATLIVSLGVALRAASAFFEGMAIAGDKVTGVLASIFNALAKIPGVGPLIMGVAAAFNSLHDYAHGVAVSFDEAGLSATGSTSAMKSGADSAAQSIYGTGNAVAALNQKMSDLLGQALSVKEAELGMAQALTGVADSARQQGTSLDFATAQGQANASALLAGAQAAAQHRQALLAAGASADFATAAYDRDMGALYRAAAAAGFNRGHVDGLIGTLRAVPPNTPANVTVTGVDSATERVLSLSRAINSLHDRVVTTTLIQNTITGETRVSVNPGRAMNRYGGVYEHAAVGKLRDASIYSAMAPARYAYAEPATGGEAFVPKRGNYGRSMAILGKAASWYGAGVVPGRMGGGAVAVQVHSDVDITVSDDTGRMFKVVRKEVRTKHGGDVQRAFGS